MDWDISQCVMDCEGDPPCLQSRWSKTGFLRYGTVESCCEVVDSYMSFEDCSYDPSDTIDSRADTLKSGNDPTTPTNTIWHPGETKCLNDGNSPEHERRYNSQETCCSTHFNREYYECMGMEQSATHKWYVSWAVGKCVKDCDASEGGSCGGLMPGIETSKHDSADACCSEDMSYMSVSECRYN